MPTPTFPSSSHKYHMTFSEKLKKLVEKLSPKILAVVGLLVAGYHWGQKAPKNKPDNPDPQPQRIQIVDQQDDQQDDGYVVVQQSTHKKNRSLSERIANAVEKSDEDRYILLQNKDFQNKKKALQQQKEITELEGDIDKILANKARQNRKIAEEKRGAAWHEENEKFTDKAVIANKTLLNAAEGMENAADGLGQFGRLLENGRRAWNILVGRNKDPR